jgi:Ser/Thr protein kinase RdoA (MazF antagonist)
MNEAATTLLGVCRKLVDPNAQPITLHAGHNNTFTLRASTADGPVIVKLHRSHDRHRQETNAYLNWTSAVRDVTPRLLAVSNNPPAIVLTVLPGQLLADSLLSPSAEAEAHRQAGAILCKFHQAAPATDAPNMTEWLPERAEFWLSRARNLLSARRQTEIRAHMRALKALGPLPAVPCHLDYTPRNLLCWTSQDKLNIGVIDFEHARRDLAARDLVRMATRVWPHREDLREAFLQGYGPLQAIDLEVIEHCGKLDLLTAAVRSAKAWQIHTEAHNDAASRPPPSSAAT